MSIRGGGGRSSGRATRTTMSWTPVAAPSDGTPVPIGCSVKWELSSIRAVGGRAALDEHARLTVSARIEAGDKLLFISDTSIAAVQGGTEAKVKSRQPFVSRM